MLSILLSPFNGLELPQPMGFPTQPSCLCLKNRILYSSNFFFPSPQCLCASVSDVAGRSSLSDPSEFPLSALLSHLLAIVLRVHPYVGPSTPGSLQFPSPPRFTISSFVRPFQAPLAELILTSSVPPHSFMQPSTIAFIILKCKCSYLYFQIVRVLKLETRIAPISWLLKKVFAKRTRYYGMVG